MFQNLVMRIWCLFSITLPPSGIEIEIERKNEKFEIVSFGDSPGNVRITRMKKISLFISLEIYLIVVSLYKSDSRISVAETMEEIVRIKNFLS